MTLIDQESLDFMVEMSRSGVRPPAGTYFLLTLINCIITKLLSFTFNFFWSFLAMEEMKDGRAEKKRGD